MEETTYAGHTTRDLADELTEAVEQARLIRRHRSPERPAPTSRISRLLTSTP